MKIMHCNKRSVIIETLWMKKLRLREIRKCIQVSKISKLQHKDTNQDFRSIKACVLSPEMCSFSHTPSNLWWTNSDESPFYVSSVWENKWGKSTGVWDREVDGQSKQSNRCSDRSGLRKHGNRWQSGEYQRRLPERLMLGMVLKDPWELSRSTMEWEV